MAAPFQALDRVVTQLCRWPDGAGGSRIRGVSPSRRGPGRQVAGDPADLLTLGVQRDTVSPRAGLRVVGRGAGNRAILDDDRARRTNQHMVQDH